MLALFDDERIRRFGRWRLLLLLSLMSAAMYLGVFAALGALLDGTAVVDRSLLITALVFGVVLAGALGRSLWKVPKHGKTGGP